MAEPTPLAEATPEADPEPVVEPTLEAEPAPMPRTNVSMVDQASVADPDNKTMPPKLEASIAATDSEPVPEAKQITDTEKCLENSKGQMETTTDSSAKIETSDLMIETEKPMAAEEAQEDTLMAKNASSFALSADSVAQQIPEADQLLDAPQAQEDDSVPNIKQAASVSEVEQVTPAESVSKAALVQETLSAPEAVETPEEVPKVPEVVESNPLIEVKAISEPESVLAPVLGDDLVLEAKSGTKPPGASEQATQEVSDDAEMETIAECFADSARTEETPPPKLDLLVKSAMVVNDTKPVLEAEKPVSIVDPILESQSQQGVDEVLKMTTSQLSEPSEKETEPTTSASGLQESIVDHALADPTIRLPEISEPAKADHEEDLEEKLNVEKVMNELKAELSEQTASKSGENSNQNKAKPAGDQPAVSLQQNSIIPPLADTIHDDLKTQKKFVASSTATSDVENPNDVVDSNTQKEQNCDSPPASTESKLSPVVAKVDTPTKIAARRTTLPDPPVAAIKSPLKLVRSPFEETEKQVIFFNFFIFLKIARNRNSIFISIVLIIFFLFSRLILSLVSKRWKKT